MTSADACVLLVETVHELSAARAELDGYRLLAVQAIHALHQEHVELTRLRGRYLRLLDARRARREAA